MEIRRLDPADRDVSPAAFGRVVTADGARPAQSRQVVWRVAEETPVAILLNGEGFAVMMATPDDLEDFAVGFALTEGLVGGPADILSLRIAEAGDGLAVNLRVAPDRAAAAADRRRRIPGRSACGICGAATVEAALPRPRRVRPAPAPSFAALSAAFSALPGAQAMKRVNRSTHAAAFCRPDGSIDTVREDLGRHNALDKLAGALARAGRDASGGFVLLSSRVSVEMVQKAAALGAPWLAAASAPSALALRVATQAGMGVAVACPEGATLFEPGCLEAPR
jgi:FdhD protein